MNREIPKNILSELIAEANADEVGLWFIIARVREEFCISDPVSIRKFTLACVMELLQSAEVVAGHYKLDGNGIEVWDMVPAQVVDRIGNAWNELGREPNIGEIAVFVGNGKKSR